MKGQEGFLDALALVGNMPEAYPEKSISMCQSHPGLAFDNSEAKGNLAEKYHAELPEKCEEQTSDDEGWIAWGSVEPPLDGGAFVEVRVQMKGSTYVTRGKVYDFVWHRTSGCERYIIAYRQIKNPKHDVNKVNETPVGIAPGADGMLLSSTIDSSADNQMRIAKIIADELPELAAVKLLRLAEALNNQIEGNKK